MKVKKFAGLRELRLAAVIFMLGVIGGACERRADSDGMKVVPGESTGTNAAVRTFDTRGLVREIAPDRKTAVIRHEDIPGYMPKMTMQLTVRDPHELEGIQVGDEISFRLHATVESHWIDTLRRLGAAAGTATNLYPVPLVTPQRRPPARPGDLFPDVTLLSESGQVVRLADFRGRALAFTFIFTRCPLPDFCPRMGRSFMQARNRLLTEAGGPTNWQFLSISFDAEHDRPEVLSTYARGYRGANADRWLFSVADTNALAVLVPATQLMVAREGASFAHNLRTVVLDPRGRVHRQFDGNSWTGEDLAAAVAEAARVPPESRPEK